MIMAVLLLSSCNDWINEAPKTDYMGEKELFSSEDAFRNYLNGIYTQLRSPELYGNNLTLGPVEFMGRTLEAPETSYSVVGAEIYEGMYEAVYSCNKILSLLDAADDVVFVSGSREMMTGEAMALRAYLHFDLVRLFSPATTLDQSTEGIAWMESYDGEPVQMTTRQLVEKVISELNLAIPILKTSDPLVTGISLNTSSLFGTNYTDRFWKMNYYGAIAIKARAHMLLGQYSEASQCAKAVIQAKSISDIINGVAEESITTQFKFISTVSGTDRAFSQEHIFAYASAQEKEVQLSFPALSNYLFYDQGINVADRIAETLSTLPADDKRLTWFNSAKTNMAPKFGGLSAGSEANVVYSWNVPQRMPGVKLGEMYLLDAEAQLRAGSSAPAKAILDEYMDKRVSSIDWGANPTSDEILEQIVAQAEIELIGEGQLFYLYKRMNASHIGSVAMTPEKYTLPIPKY